MKKLTIMAVVAVIANLLIVAGVYAGSPWSLFGDATAVKQGQGPNPWAIQLVSDASTQTPYGGVAFQQPQDDLAFSEIYQLSTDYNVTDDDCGGGSPRFQLNMDTDGDGDSDGNVFVYIGPLPNFTSCSTGWQSTDNLIGLPNPDTRYDLTQVGGTFYDTYNNALSLLGDKQVLGIQLVADGGWALADGEQTILVDNVRVNNHKLTAKGFSK